MARSNARVAPRQIKRLRDLEGRLDRDTRKHAPEGLEFRRRVGATAARCTDHRRTSRRDGGARGRIAMIVVPDYRQHRIDVTAMPPARAGGTPR
jgi:hypothetical protein